MAGARKLQGLLCAVGVGLVLDVQPASVDARCPFTAEIDRTLKRIEDGLVDFDSIHDKVMTAEAQPAKTKLEEELKKGAFTTRSTRLGYPSLEFSVSVLAQK